MSPKDEEHAFLIQKWIDRLKKRVDDERIEIEVPYNYFGNRGVVDLVLKQNNGHTLYEFKTELRDIGKTIRQVKNQAEYYPKDKEGEVSSSNLVLYNKRKNREILSKNKNLFEDIEVILYVPTLQLSGRAFSDRGEFHLESFFRKLGFIKSYNVPSEKNYFFGTDFYSDRGTLETILEIIPEVKEEEFRNLWLPKSNNL